MECRSALPHRVGGASFRGRRLFACGSPVPLSPTHCRRHITVPLRHQPRTRWAQGRSSPGAAGAAHSFNVVHGKYSCQLDVSGYRCLSTSSAALWIPKYRTPSNTRFTSRYLQTKNCHRRSALRDEGSSSKTQFQTAAALALRITPCSSPATLRPSLPRPSPGSSALAPPMLHAFPPTAARQTRISP